MTEVRVSQYLKSMSPPANLENQEFDFDAGAQFLDILNHTAQKNTSKSCEMCFKWSNIILSNYFAVYALHLVDIGSLMNLLNLKSASRHPGILYISELQLTIVDYDSLTTDDCLYYMRHF